MGSEEGLVLTHSSSHVELPARGLPQHWQLLGTAFPCARASPTGEHPPVPARNIYLFSYISMLSHIARALLSL